MLKWTSSDIPLQRGRTAIVTGTGGLGFETALALACAGATVIIAGRNRLKGEQAVQGIEGLVPGAAISFAELDLASLDSIKVFAGRMRRSLDSLDILINNAAVMNPPQREVTRDGFELQFGTNFLGHFALTALLIPLLRRGKGARVISLSSIAARQGNIELSKLQSDAGYQPMAAYAQSKLACLMFALELHRRSEAGNWGIQSVAVHPGISRTELLPNGAGAWSAAGMARRFLWFLFQPAEQGAWPTLFAATSPDAQAGAYYGPNKLGETRGYPAAAKLPPQALDTEMAGLLWSESERLSGVAFPREELNASNAAA
ncbi:MAG: SDR family oxidoreductase [Pseudomonadota bacterium]